MWVSMPVPKQVACHSQVIVGMRNRYLSRWPKTTTVVEDHPPSNGTPASQFTAGRRCFFGANIPPWATRLSRFTLVRTNSSTRARLAQIELAVAGTQFTETCSLQPPLKRRLIAISILNDDKGCTSEGIKTSS